MSRFSSDKEREPQPAFSGTKQHKVEQSITSYAFQQRRMHQESFTTEELKLLFIPEEWRRSLSQAYELTFAEPYGWQRIYVAFPNVQPLAMHKPRISFTFNYDQNNTGFLVPSVGYKVDSPAHVLESAPPELVERFNELVRHETQVSYEWGLVRWVFRELNKVEWCTTPAQIRYLWPCIYNLCRKQKSLEELAKSIEQASPRAGDKAKCPPWAIRHLKESYDVVARIALMDNLPVLDAIPATVSYELVNPTFQVNDRIEFQGS